MHNRSCVYFKATKDNIYVVLDPIADFCEIKEALAIKSSRSKRFFGEGDAFIIFKGRLLTDDEESQLVKVIEGETDLRVYVSEEKEHDDIYSEESPVSPPFPLNTIKMPKDLNTALFHKGSLRSGMCVEGEGSVIIIGDVNPGGEIIAGGNIIVLGTLKGLAHAGVYGDKNAFVAALSLQPVQLRIANMITTIAEELGKQGKTAANTPSYAYVLDERIYIEPLV